MPESVKKAFIAVFIILIAAFVIKSLIHKDYPACKPYTALNINYKTDSVSSYLPIIYEVNKGCIAVMQERTKSELNACQAMDYLFSNIAFIDVKESDRTKFYDHLYSAQEAMKAYDKCRAYKEYTRWIEKFKSR